MISIEVLTTFFGWCTVVNFGFILLAALFFSVFHEGIGKIHARMFGVTREQAKSTLFSAFQHYRISVLVLNLVPYLALKFMVS